MSSITYPDQNCWGSSLSKDASDCTVSVLGLLSVGNACLGFIQKNSCSFVVCCEVLLNDSAEHRHSLEEAHFCCRYPQSHSSGHDSQLVVMPRLIDEPIKTQHCLHFQLSLHIGSTGPFINLPLSWTRHPWSCRSSPNLSVHPVLWSTPSLFSENRMQIIKDVIPRPPDSQVSELVPQWLL